MTLWTTDPPWMMEETRQFGTLIMNAHDWDDKDAWINSLELFAKEVMPSLNKSLGYN
jgi:hypothetical protein